MDKCPVCKETTKGKFWCSSCKSVFVCPSPSCGAEIRKRDLTECPRCALIFADYIQHRKMYRICPKCKKKQGVAEPQCRHCRYWFQCPTCGHRVPSTSMLTCPRCATSLR
jgi:hypothetical protein